MNRLYTKVVFQNNEQLIILNQEFTKEQIKEKMVQKGCASDYADSITKEGIYTDNPHMVIIKAEWDDQALLVEVYEDGTETIKDICHTIHIYVNPDATWEKKQALWKKMVGKLKK